MNVQKYFQNIPVSAAILCSLILLQGCSGDQDDAGSKVSMPAAPTETAKAASDTAPAAAGAAAPAPAASGIDAKALYTACAVCHAAGVANAPIFGKADAWAPRIATGMDAMVATAIKGKGAMPPKGGRADYSDAQIKAIVEYMVNASK